MCERGWDNGEGVRVRVRVCVRVCVCVCVRVCVSESEVILKLILLVASKSP